MDGCRKLCGMQVGSKLYVGCEKSSMRVRGGVIEVVNHSCGNPPLHSPRGYPSLARIITTQKATHVSGPAHRNRPEHSAVPSRLFSWLMHVDVVSMEQAPRGIAYAPRITLNTASQGTATTPQHGSL